MTKKPTDELMARAKALGWRLLAHWDQLGGSDWLPRLLEVEEVERKRRITNTSIGTIKQMYDSEPRSRACRG